ncbi:class I glutamine amidotransferase-like protein [Mycena vulgaris]|nr:class I glutamine amidotransferase-like protein [Mycena vulgaris]
MSKSIVLLVCDTPIPSVVSDHGDYHVLFTDLLAAAAAQLGISDIAAKCTLDPYDVVHTKAYPSDTQLDACGGILITGSKFSAYEDVDWINKLVDFVARVAATRPALKIVGICFGHQIVARALGGRCVNSMWEVGPTPIALTPLGQEIFGVESMYIEEMHRDHVPEIPPTFHLLGSTPIAMNQAMVRFVNGAAPSSPVSLADIHILTVQGHPEFNEPIVSKIVAARTASGVITAEIAADAGQRAHWQNDGVGVVAKVILGMYGLGQ